jgi:hypothetical protein
MRVLENPRLADSTAIAMWVLAQEFWKKGRSLVPKEIFETLDDADKLIECKLARLKGDFVYVCGSSQYLDWLFEEKEKRARGGRTSAQRPRDEKGRLLPDSSPGEIQVKSSCDPSEASSVQVSVSGSVSGSKNNNYPREEISNSTKSDLAVAQLPNQSEVFEKQFDGDGLEAVAEVLRQAFDGPPPRHIARKHAQILTYFVDADTFAEWTHDVINAKNCPDPAKDPPGFRSYFLATLSKTLRGEA